MHSNALQPRNITPTIAQTELDVIIGNTKVASHDNELQENISHEYLQAVGLGKEIRYDLTSITVKFMLLQV